MDATILIESSTSRWTHQVYSRSDLRPVLDEVARRLEDMLARRDCTAIAVAVHPHEECEHDT